MVRQLRCAVAPIEDFFFPFFLPFTHLCPFSWSLVFICVERVGSRSLALWTWLFSGLALCLFLSDDLLYALGPCLAFWIYLLGSGPLVPLAQASCH